MAQKRARAISMHPFHLRTWRSATCFSLGMAVLVLGLVSLYFAAATHFITLFSLGLILLGSGLLQALYTASAKQGSEATLGMADATIYMLGGLYLMNHPLLDSQILMPALAGFYILSGLLREAAAFHLIPRFLGRENLKADRTWAAIGGLAAFVIAFLLVSGWHVVGLNGLTALIGLDLVLLGLHLAETNVRAWEG